MDKAHLEAEKSKQGAEAARQAESSMRQAVNTERTQRAKDMGAMNAQFEAHKATLNQQLTESQTKVPCLAGRVLACLRSSCRGPGAEPGVCRR